MVVSDAPELPFRQVGKSPSAFRTIAEVATELALPQHVLRFWETKFPQIKPLKRRGGRRYYRPDDIELLRRIKRLLHEDGFTIRGAQKYLRENSVVVRSPSTPHRVVENSEPLQSDVAAIEPDTVSAGRHLVDETRAVIAELEDLRRLLRTGAP
jgi:DNA-binding transcriptional MerR regulator